MYHQGLWQLLDAQQSGTITVYQPFMEALTQFFGGYVLGTKRTIFRLIRRHDGRHGGLRLFWQWQNSTTSIRRRQQCKSKLQVRMNERIQFDIHVYAIDNVLLDLIEDEPESTTTSSSTGTLEFQNKINEIGHSTYQVNSSWESTVPALDIGRNSHRNTFHSHSDVSIEGQEEGSKVSETAQPQVFRTRQLEVRNE
jgi:hypothetical protein